MVMSRRHGEVVLRRGMMFFLLTAVISLGLIALAHERWATGGAALVSAAVLFPETEHGERYGRRIAAERWRMAAIIAAVWAAALLGPLLFVATMKGMWGNAFTGVSLLFGGAYACWRRLAVK
jgi:hypothetical protein